MGKETIWTAKQTLAIETRDKTLLVSAAAGSGKTATLTERIIRSILDEEHPVDIENLLIVTFTRLAARELQEKIAKAIRKRLAADPGNARLERQLYMLPCAKITTIDAFCIDILRQNAEMVGAEAGFRIPDEAEMVILGENLLDGLLNEIANGGLPDIATPEQMDALTDCLTNTGRQNSLAEVINHLYLSTENSEHGVEELLPLVEEYSPDGFCGVESCGFGKYIMSRLDGMVEHYVRLFNMALRSLEDGGVTGGGVYDQVLESLSLLDRIRAAATYAERREILLGASFARAQRAVGAFPYSTLLRNAFKEEIEYFRDKLFYFPDDDWRVAYVGLHEQLSTLYRIIAEYDRLLTEEKLRRGILQFSDILRLTYRCLWDGDRLTDAALAQRARFDAVYIDEYQDVNGLQNRIFDAICTDTNRFMVGDIKQSIYAFRSARADIFASLKKEYPPIAEAADSPRATIFMSDNFRCDRGIVDFVNTIFDRIFPLIGESIGYVDEDRLGYAKVYETEPPYLHPSVCLVDLSGAKDEYKRAGVELDCGMAAPAVVAEKIRELIDHGRKTDGTPIEAGDIAVIMRKAKGRAERYKRAIEALGIPAAVADENRFFLNAECRLALCLLNAVDDPHSDIYLAGLMMSPLYGFTADEMLLIGKEGGETLYDSLRSYCERTPSFERGANFLRAIERYRLLSEGMAVDELVMRLWNETGLLSLATDEGSTERLLLIYEHARAYERGASKGLYGFITYLNGISGRKNSLDKREAPKDDHAVNIITAHGSKGLEYPVVFLVEADENFGYRRLGEAPRYEYEEGFGIGMVLRTPGGIAPVRNATREVVLDYRRRRELEEEARILYVALTRAREQLYVVCTDGSGVDKYMKQKEFFRLCLDEYSIYSATNYMDMILGACDFKIKTQEDLLENVPQVLIAPEAGAEDTAETEKVDTPAAVDKENANNSLDKQDESTEMTDGELEELLRERLTYKYTKDALCRLPAKLSVSALYPQVLDDTDDDATDAQRYRRDKAQLRLPGRGIRPKFLSGTERDSATKRGTATHMFFQFCDPERLADLGASAELVRLREQRFLSDEDAARVSTDEIELFRSSELLLRMRSARRLIREFRFNVKLPAEMFTADAVLAEQIKGEELLVQGVIDCLYEDDSGELHLVDYKTDRLTKNERECRELAAARLRRDHGDQLRYYAEAVKRIYGSQPVSVEVYSTQLGCCFSVL